jgi:ABC-type dipeptide/oligopeptide/nickel transport system permease subunit
VDAARTVVEPIGGLVRPARRLAWRRHLRPGGTAGLVMFAGAVLAGLLAPLIAPYGYDEQDLVNTLLPPLGAGGAWLNALGTDQLGRDVLSRILYGARVSLLLSGSAVLVAGCLGVLLGLVSGYLGGWLDAVVTRIADLQLSFPYLLLAIAFMALLKPSLVNLVAVLVLRSWVVYARVVRASVLSVKERDYVALAMAIGASQGRLLFRHVAPNVLSSVLVVSSFQLAELIIVESSLSFLGLGVQPPTPSWGSMLAQGREYVFTAWWLVTFPGLAIILAVLGANLFGDSLRDLLDPRVRRS